MSRTLYTRVFSLALTFWLPLFMSGAEWVVRCPTHGGAATAAMSHGTSASNAAEHDHGASDHAPDGQPGSGHSCSCAGPGCCPPAVAVVPGDTVPMSRVVAVHEAAAVATLDRLASESDHVLPFATAPPAVALAPAATTVA